MNSIIFQALDWVISDYNETDDCADINNFDEFDENSIVPKYLIKVFGKDMNGKNYSLNIRDYKPHFYIKGIDNLNGIRHNENIKDYAHTMIINKLREYIESKLKGQFQNSLEICKIVRKKDLWGFTNNKSFKFILLSFSNFKAMKIASNLFTKSITFGTEYKNIKFQLYENNIEPYLRFIHKQDLQISGWLKVDISKCDKTYDFNIKDGDNYNVNWKDVKPFECNKIAPFIVSSFDIECTSYDGSFPCAIKTYEKFIHGLLDYHNTLNNLLKEEKQEKIYDYIIDTLQNGTLNYKSPLNIDEVSKNVMIHIDDIMSILKGKLLLKTEEIIKVKKTKITHYFSNQDEIEQSFTELSSTEIVEKMVDKFSKFLPKLNGDPIIQIGTTFHKYGSKDCFKKIIVALDTCDDIEGSKVISCKTEKQVIIKWIEIMNSVNPDIITGYNIFGFDFDYIYHRALELNCAEYLCNLGKLVEPIKECKFDDCGYCKTHWTKKTLSSSALGDNFLKYINPEGRVLIDLMKVIQSGHNLDTYKLDFVSQHFINGKINKIEYDDDDNDNNENENENENDDSNKQIRLYLDNPIGIQKFNYLSLDDTKFYIDDINHYEKYIVIEKDYELFDKSKKYKKWGLAKDDVTPQEIFECQKGSSKDRARVAKYCIQDCALCNYLIIKLEIIANNIGMSNVCSIPFSYIFLRGQGVKIFSLIAKQCKEDNFLIPYQDKKWKCEGCFKSNSSFDDFCQKKDSNDNLICLRAKPENEGFEGAIVLEPKPGIYINEPISVLDYASLYPSSMISENISHDTLVIDEKYDNLPGYEYVDITFDLFKGKGDAKKKIGEQTCRYVQFPNSEKGLLPRILQKLLKQRKATRKKITWKTITLNTGEEYKGNVIDETDTYIKMKVEDKNTIEIDKNKIKSNIYTHNDFEKAILDGLQLAYKLTANSLYGQVGAPTSPIFMKELAASTTATGRNLILSAKKFAEEQYNCEVVYGDTDSVFIKLPPLSCYKKYGHPTEKQNILQYNVDVGEQLSADFQKLLKPPHCLEWEKMFYPFIIFSKKRYVGNLYEHDVNKFKQKSMGIVLKRRDNANIVKIIYGGVIDIILNEVDINKSLEFLDKSLKRLANGEYPLEELVVTKTLRGFYKNPLQIAHKVLADRMKKRDPGSAPQSNDRVPYVYINVKEKNNIKLLQGDKIEDPKFIIENKLTPDYGHYITNQIMKPCLQLYSIVLEDLKGYKYKNNKDYWIKLEKNLMAEKKDKVKVETKIKQLREKNVEELLFSKYINKIKNEKNGTTAMSNFISYN